MLPVRAVVEFDFVRFARYPPRITGRCGSSEIALETALVVRADFILTPLGRAPKSASFAPGRRGPRNLRSLRRGFIL